MSNISAWWFCKSGAQSAVTICRYLPSDDERTQSRSSQRTHKGHLTPNQS